MTNKNKSPALTPSQIACAVKDAEKSKIFFQEMVGVKNTKPAYITRLQDQDGNYYGEPVEAETLLL